MLVVWLLGVNVVGNPPRVYKLQNILACMDASVQALGWECLFLDLFGFML
jgi:hypothetical protein